MKRRNAVLLILLAIVILAVAYGAAIIRRGFSAADQPSAVERVVSRTVRNLGIPGSARDEKNLFTPTQEGLQEARELFTNPCTSCHTDKTTTWAAEAMRHWPERSPWRAE